MIKEFVSKKSNSCAVVNVEVTSELHCTCGKTSKVELDYEMVRGYYDDVELFLEVKCPHCGSAYEKNEY